MAALENELNGLNIQKYIFHVDLWKNRLLKILFRIDFITKQIEKKVGMDLNGDGVIGSGMHLFKLSANW